jgi:hypothetical protein
VIDALKVAAGAFKTTLPELLGRSENFIYGTTHAINAIITGNVARTAFVTTAGHPDVLTLREGGRLDPFNFTVPYPEPYVPRSLTFEAPGRILADGSVATPFDDSAMIAAIEAMKRKNVEAVAVCLLWSIVNPEHELRVGELIEKHMLGIPYTLSHKLNPTLREYRRACSACIDASLKPMMAAYMERLTRDLRDNGLSGRALVVTSQGGVIDAAEVANKPIHLINSGPSMAPISGRYFAQVDEGSDRHHRRHWSHDLRHQPRQSIAHPVDARDLDRLSLSGPHDGIRLGRCEKRGRGRRLYRVGGRRRHAAYRAEERGGRSGTCVLRQGWTAADCNRRSRSAWLHRSRLLSRGRHYARSSQSASGDRSLCGPAPPALG